MSINPYAPVRPILGGSLTPGKAYHDIPGETGPTFRQGSQARADHIAQHLLVNGLHGLDLGCAVGGISFGLETHGAVMTGVDYDQSSIVTANDVAQRRRSTCTFVAADLTSADTWAWIEGSGFDFAVWLSNWMWLAKQDGPQTARDRLRQLSETIPILVFETAQGPGDGQAGTTDVVGAGGVADLLAEHTVYDEIVPIGTGPLKWCGNRTVFVCRR